MKHLIMGTAGHIDHGKTTLIKALTNIDCDTHKEEKQRKITINLGFAHLKLPNGNTIGIIDVPGHKSFINTMVSGATGIDFVLFTIAADSGVMPQTIEHLNIIKALNIQQIIVALTKIDLVDEDMIALAQEEIQELFEKNNFKNVPIIPVSSTSKKGIPELIENIEKISPLVKEKNDNGIFRMYIDRIFTVAGHGSVVTGSILSGKINIGETLYLLPSEKKLRVKNIQRHGENVNQTIAGDRAAINLSGLKKEDFKRGMLLSDQILNTSTMVDAYIELFPDSKAQLKNWSTLLFHSGTFESQIKMHLLDCNKLEKNEKAIVQIHLQKEAILFNKDRFN